MLQERGIQCMRGRYEKVRPVPRKAGIRCTLPYFVEWALVGSRSLLFDPLRNSLRAGARQRTSLAHPARSPQFAELTLDCHVGVAAFMMRRRVAVCECIVIILIPLI
jgi:hypothetical protein